MVAESGGQSVAVLPDHGRKLIAVVYADMVGYSRLIGLDDAGTYERLQELRRDLIDPALVRHGGTLVSTGGDSLLVRFDSIIPAMRFAVDVQRGVPDFDSDYARDSRIRFRMGVNVGDAIPDGMNLHGEGVNVAARLQSVCPPGAICVSRVVRDHIGNRLGLKFEPLGPLTLKNIAQPVEAFTLDLDAGVPTTAPLARRRLRQMALAGIAALMVVGALLAAIALYPRLHPSSSLPPLQASAAQAPEGNLPPLSIAVLPFTNLSGDPEQAYLADGISEDLTTDLSNLDNAFVIARESAFTYRGKAVDVRDVGRQLGVRYVVEGSVRKLGDIVRINAQLVSTDTGVHIWADRFDQPLHDLQAGQNSTVERIGSALNVKFDHARQQPTAVASNPTAYDLILRAKSVLREPKNESQDSIAAGYFEQALRLDPTSAPAKAGVATMLLKTDRSMKRATDLITRAEWEAPNSPDVLAAKFRLLRRQQRYQEATATFQKLLDLDSSAAGLVAEFDYCSLCWGPPESALELIDRTARLNPLSPNRDIIYYSLGRMMLLLGRDAEAIDWLERAQHLISGRPPSQLRGLDGSGNATKSLLSAAYALTGQIDDAHAMLASVMSSPGAMDFTVRSFLNTIPKYYNAHQRQQELRIATGLRKAGLRDHLDEQADYNVLSTPYLHDDLHAPTPTSVPGATTITTEEMVRLLEIKPVVLTTASANPTIPGSIRFDVPTSGTLTDEWQTALAQLIDQVTNGDKQRPVAAFSYSINWWISRNLALRLVALGYRNVYWYRGGWEAWDAHDLPMAPLDLQFTPQR
jgi:adenylate cyclase